MGARLLFVALDAAEATLIERWAAEGRLPAFAELARTGCTAPLANCMETLPGAIWPELTTGRSAGRVPLYFHPRQLRTGEARRRPIEAVDVDPEDYFWTVAGRAGRRVAVIDPVQAVDSPAAGGLQLYEFGLHDRYFDTRSSPPHLLEELRSRHGRHPVADAQRGDGGAWACDGHGGTAEGYERLRRGLIGGVELKTAIALDLLAREDWDLFFAVYGESHCVGHQFWHALDPSHRAHDPAAPEPVHRAILDVYREIDRGIGALLEAVGPETTVLVVASHGMGPYIGGPQLLPELLVRLGYASGGRGILGRALRRVQGALKRSPRRFHGLLRRLASLGPVRTAQASAGGLVDPLESPRTRAASLINNRCGAIRLNLAGREPYGRVQPGAEAEALIAELRTELAALVDPASGEPIVTRTVTAAEAFGERHHPDVPDLLISFRTDLGPLEACRSERAGLIEVPSWNPNYPRTGDHTVESRLWIRGPGIGAATDLAGANVLDLAPTVLSLLGVPVPERIDGRPLPVGQGERVGSAG